MNPQDPRPVAIIGAGIGGAACARALTEAGLQVVVFDKSRGVGGRLSTRRASLALDDGTSEAIAFDHGAQYFTPRDSEFISLVQRGLREKWIAPWTPRLLGGGDDEPFFVGTPDMPAVVRALLRDIEVRVGTPVTALRRVEAGWQIQTDRWDDQAFQAVVLAMPPAQAAALIADHQPFLSAVLKSSRMQPCWTLMAAIDEIPLPFEAMKIASGPLAWVARNDTKPERARVKGVALLVAQAGHEWSGQFKDSSPQEIEPLLQQALSQALGGAALRFRHSAVHRWLYARAGHQGAGAWWNQPLSIGVCGDHVEHSRVEGAYLSGIKLARQMLG